MPGLLQGGFCKGASARVLLQWDFCKGFRKGASARASARGLPQGGFCKGFRKGASARASARRLLQGLLQGLPQGGFCKGASARGLLQGGFCKGFVYFITANMSNSHFGQVACCALGEWEWSAKSFHKLLAVPWESGSGVPSLFISCLLCLGRVGVGCQVFS